MDAWRATAALPLAALALVLCAPQSLAAKTRDANRTAVTKAQQAADRLRSVLAGPKSGCQLSGKCEESPPAELQVESFERGLANVMPKSSGNCALGVKLLLNRLFGCGPEGGRPAKKYDEKALRGWRTEDSCYSLFEQIPPPGVELQPKDFDIRVLQPTKKWIKADHPWGHMEIYYQGSWYSDFKQRSSLWESGNYSKYSGFRLGECASVGWLEGALKQLWALVSIPEAVAGEEGTAPSRDLVTVASGSWRLIDRSRGESVVYVLQKVEGAKKTDVDEDQESPFMVLERNAKALGKAGSALAQAYVADLVRSEGRETVQEIVSGLPELTPLQKEAYLKQGFKLHPRYKLVFPSKD